MAVWHSLGHLLYFSQFGMFGPIKIWQPWSTVIDGRQVGNCEELPSSAVSVVQIGTFLFLRQFLQHSGSVMVSDNCPQTLRSEIHTQTKKKPLAARLNTEGPINILLLLER
jgi:hypothetical protein